MTEADCLAFCYDRGFFWEESGIRLYDVLDREKLCGKELSLLGTEREDMQRILEQLLHVRSVYACAKQQETVTECENEREAERYRLSLCMEKERDLLPERTRLGTQLGIYYKGKTEEQERECTAVRTAIRQMEEERAQGAEEIRRLRDEAERLVKEAGALGARLAGFDEAEDRFNRLSSENWRRNILGEYEPGLFLVRLAEYDRQLQETERGRLIDAEWEESAVNDKGGEYLAELKMYADDRRGLLMEISRLLAEAKIDVKSMNIRTSKKGTATIDMGFIVTSREQLTRVIEKLRQLEGVMDIERTAG